MVHHFKLLVIFPFLWDLICNMAQLSESERYHTGIILTHYGMFTGGHPFGIRQNRYNRGIDRHIALCVSHIREFNVMEVLAVTKQL